MVIKAHYHYNAHAAQICIYRATRGLRAPDIRPRPDPRETLGRPWAPNGAKIVLFEMFCTTKCKQRLCIDPAVPLRPPSVSPPSPNCSRTQPLWVIYRCPEVRQVSMDSQKPAPKAHPIWPKGVPRAAKQQPRQSLWRPPGPSGGEVPPQMPPQIFQQPLRTQRCPPVYGRFITHAAARRVLCEMHDSSLSLSCSLSGSLALYTMIFSILMYAHT